MPGFREAAILGCSLVTEPNNEAIAAPKLDVATVEKPPGFLDRLVIVGTNQRL